MAYPQSGYIKIYPASTSILGGQFSLNSDAAPQPVRSDAILDAYYQARVTNLAIAPCLRRATEIPAASGVYVPIVGDHELSFSASTSDIEFYDGAYPSAPVATTDFFSAAFPLGMEVSDLQVWWSGQTYFGPSRDRNITDMKLNYFGGVVYDYAPGAVGLLTGTIASPNTAIIASLHTWSPLRIFKPFGITVPVNNIISVLLNTPRSVISECFILGVYNTQKFSLTNHTPLVLPGEIARITDANSRLASFSSYKVYWDTNPDLDEEDVDPNLPGLTGGVTIDNKYFYTHTTGEIEFQMPTDLGIPYGGRRLLLVGVGLSAFFLGEFPIANFNVLLTDGSGVYQLTAGQRHDTYYDRSTIPPTQVNLKMPRPRIRTGFF